MTPGGLWRFLAVTSLSLLCTLGIPAPAGVASAELSTDISALHPSSAASSLAPPSDRWALATPDSRADREAKRLDQQTRLERQTGLIVSLDAIEPAALVAGEPLTLAGSVRNDGTTRWRDAQVYLDITRAPATTRTALTTFANGETLQSTRIIKIGLFDEIGAVRPGEAKSYTLTVPFGQLPIDETAGVYSAQVSVLAQNEEGRDQEADAQVGTLLPLLPDNSDEFRPTSVVTLLPVTAPVLRQSNGSFLSDKLASDLSSGGRLRNVLDFAASAPRGALQVVVDPALHAAVSDMAGGYLVQTLQDSATGDRGDPGTGQRAATEWLASLEEVASRQRLSFMTWGSPDVSALAAHAMPGIVAAAVAASHSYTAGNSLNDSLVGWQTDGLSSRRGLSLSRRSGTSVQLVAEQSLSRITAPAADYPSSVVTVHTRLGPLTTVVIRRDVAGEPVTADLLQFRQGLMAEATVRSLLDDPEAQCAVFAMPFRWDPGLTSTAIDLSPAYRFAAIAPTTVDVVNERVPRPYAGPVEAAVHQPPFPEAVFAAVASLRDNGRVFTGMLSRPGSTVESLDRQLGVAGSAFWRWRPHIGAAMIRHQAGEFAQQISRVTVTGPTFVALSSESGSFPFPLTVTNGLDVPITVGLDVRPQNPALQIEPIDDLQLAAGQRRDVQVVSRSSGSGLTEVRVRLSTPDDRIFGAPWDFNVRATQFGVVIWIAMGVGGAVLFGAAAVRIYRRVRDSRRKAPPEPAAA